MVSSQLSGVPSRTRLFLFEVTRRDSLDDIVTQEGLEKETKTAGVLTTRSHQHFPPGDDKVLQLWLCSQLISCLGNNLE